MNEARFVDFLKKRFPFTHGAGIGDDASAVRSGNGYQLVTTDVLIENVHFRLKDFSPGELALKSLAVNLSDIAAMGGEPLYFYLGLGFPDRKPLADLKRFFAGLQKGCRRWKVELAGGDYSRSRQMFISITLVGNAKRPVFRHGARTGDWIGLTGPVGESALGLRLLLKGIRSPYWSQRHKTVVPEIEKGMILARRVHSMIDVSDGLLIDLKRILDASGAGARIDYERIPVSTKMRSACRRYDIDERELVLSGGEDYALLFTVSEKNEKKLRRDGIGYTRIGKVTAGRGLVVRDSGMHLNVRDAGFDHFRQSHGGKR